MSALELRILANALEDAMPEAAHCECKRILEVHLGEAARELRRLATLQATLAGGQP